MVFDVQANPILTEIELQVAESWFLLKKYYLIYHFKQNLTQFLFNKQNKSDLVCSRFLKDISSSPSKFNIDTQNYLSLKSRYLLNFIPKQKKNINEHFFWGWGGSIHWMPTFSQDASVKYGTSLWRTWVVYPQRDRQNHRATWVVYIGGWNPTHLYRDCNKPL